jgi:hypothetical protein
MALLHNSIRVLRHYYAEHAGFLGFVAQLFQYLVPFAATTLRPIVKIGHR